VKKEIEVVIIDVDFNSLVKKLKKLKAKEIYNGFFYDYFYDKKSKKLKKNNQVLRLRKLDDGSAIITFKENPVFKDYKIRDEYEITSNDFLETKKIFEKLGYVLLKKRKMKRTIYLLDDVFVDFHDLLDKQVPIYLEVEGPTKKQILDVAKKLGFTKKDLHSSTTKEVINKFKK